MIQEWQRRNQERNPSCRITLKLLTAASQYMLAFLLKEGKISCGAGHGSSKMFSLRDTSPDCVTPEETKLKPDSFARADESKPETVLLSATEMATEMDESLEKHRMRRIKIEGDGNCLYRCFAHHIHKSEEHHMEIRKSVADHICQNAQFYKNLHVKSEADDLSWDLWKATLYTDGAWGNKVTLYAAANLFKCVVMVYVDGNRPFAVEPTIFGTDGPAVKPESTLYLAYFKGTHFDVAVPKSNDDLVLINQELAQTPLKAQGRAPELDKSIVTKDPELSLTPLKDAIDEIMISVNEIKAIQRSQIVANIAAVFDVKTRFGACS